MPRQQGGVDVDATEAWQVEEFAPQDLTKRKYQDQVRAKCRQSGQESRFIRGFWLVDFDAVFFTELPNGRCCEATFTALCAVRLRSATDQVDLLAVNETPQCWDGNQAGTQEIDPQLVCGNPLVSETLHIQINAMRHQLVAAAAPALSG